MPRRPCAVAICPNKDYPPVENLSFHRFPKDVKMRKAWILRCKRKDDFNPETSRICSDHFTEEDFEIDMKAKLMGTPSKRRLKQDAIPSLKLLPEGPQISSQKASAKLARRERMLEKGKKKEHEQIIAGAMAQSHADYEENVQQADETPQIQTDSDIREMYFKLLEEKNLLQTKYDNICQRLNETLQELSASQCSEKEANSALRQIFTENEISLLMNKKKMVCWTDEEIANAFTLRYLSKRSYIYLRQKKGYPLPGISTLKRWAGKVTLRNGILENILRMMEIGRNDFSSIERLCVISFDEVKVRETLEYDEHEDEVVGPHKQLQVAMVRSLTGKWKQPVYINFDTKMSKEIINDIIVRLHKINFTVVSLVSDCGGGNVGLWKELDVTTNKPYFLHPITGEPIVYMPDAPHLLKLLRNWLLDSEFILKDGGKTNKTPLVALLNLVSSEISVCPKLRESHLTCEGAQRQNVALAAQLISNTVGTALVHYKPGEDKELALNSGNFINLINRWFDLMNVYTPKISTPSCSAYGLKIDEQNNLLSDVKTVIGTMRCGKKNTLQIFQKGIIMSCNALPLLFNSVAVYGVKYILTHRLNQDCLENLFAQLRSKGGLHDHPSPLEAVQRLRLILLGRNPGMVQSNTNVTVHDDENYIFTTILRKTSVEPPTPALENHDFEGIFGSDSSDSSSTTSDEDKETTHDGLHYTAGWLAFKFKNKFPHLRKSDELTFSADHRNYCLPNWIQHLSYGGLTEPSEDFFNGVLNMEKYFNSFTKKKGIIKRPGIVRCLSSKIFKKLKEELPLIVIKKFIRLRVIIRMKFTAQQNESLKKNRKLKQDLKKTVKKMKLMT